MPLHFLLNFLIFLGDMGIIIVLDKSFGMYRVEYLKQQIHINCFLFLFKFNLFLIKIRCDILY